MSATYEEERMLSEARNRELTQTGPDTRMGRLLRRYWWPVAITSDLADFPRRAVRLLGEDLVVFRDGSGRYGLLDRVCPHRGASLAYGICEADGLRCGYHGWLFDADGRCLEQPGEPPGSTFHEQITVRAHRVEELGGLVWGYLGPEPAPKLPRYDVFVSNGGFRDIGHTTFPVNWVHVMENAVDPHHVEWLHRRYFMFLHQRRGLEPIRKQAQVHTRIEYEPFEHGIIKRRVSEGGSEDDDPWKIGQPVVFPAMAREGGGRWDSMRIRVPIDDTTTWFILYTVHHPSPAANRPQRRIPAYQFPWKDERGELLLDFIEAQDIMAWVTQGAVAGREREHLGKEDVGVVTLRQMFFAEMDKVDAGEDPIAVIREPHDVIDLPCKVNELGANAQYPGEWLPYSAVRYSPAFRTIERLYASSDPNRPLLQRLRRLRRLRRRQRAVHAPRSAPSGVLSR